MASRNIPITSTVRDIKRWLSFLDDDQLICVETDDTGENDHAHIIVIDENALPQAAPHFVIDLLETLQAEQDAKQNNDAAIVVTLRRSAYVLGHASDCAKQDAINATCTCEAAKIENPAIQDACRDLDGFEYYKAVADALAHAGYVVGIEFPLYIDATALNGESCVIAFDRYTESWTIGTSSDTPTALSESVTVEIERITETTPADDAAAIVDATDAFTDRAHYATAADRRKADRDEQAARNGGR